jgi:prepilin peptidase CpaA
MFLILYAVLTDITSLRIPNWISVSLVFLFAVFAMSEGDTSSAIHHIAVALAVLLAGFLLYAMSWIGAGDVKLVAAVALWVGPGGLAQFLFLTSLAGLALALFVKGGALFLAFAGCGEQPSTLARLYPRWARRGLIPYGFAIGVGALAALPVVFF